MRQVSRAWLPLLLAVLALIALFSVWKMRATALLLDSVARETRVCAGLAADIIAIRELPAFAVLEAESLEETFEHIQRAADATPLPASALIRIQPESPTQLGESAYRLRPTRLELREVTLRQMIVFAHQLVDENRGLTVRDLRFWEGGSDRRSSGEETWSVELTLTQLIFSPKSRQSPSLRPPDSPPAGAYGG